MVLFISRGNKLITIKPKYSDFDAENILNMRLVDAKGNQIDLEKCKSLHNKLVMCADKEYVIL